MRIVTLQFDNETSGISMIIECSLESIVPIIDMYHCCYSGDEYKIKIKVK